MPTGNALQILVFGGGYAGLEVVRTLARLLAPFLPETAVEIRALLGMAEDAVGFGAPWGKGFAPGHKISGPKMLFPRIETVKKN